MSVNEALVAAFYVDVNSAGDSGKVGTTRQAAVDGFGNPADATVGTYVYAIDADNNACTALVTAMNGDWIELHMDESTWQPFATEATLGRDDRVSLAGISPEDALRALLKTPPTP